MNHVIDFLVYTLVLSALIQASKDRFYVALIFSMLTLTHNIISASFSPLLMYFSAAITDLLIVCLIMTSSSEMTRKLIIVSIWSIVLNGIGYILWQYYVSPFAYDLAFICLYTYAIISMHRGNDVGHNTGNWHDIWILGRISKGFGNLHSMEKNK